MYIARSSRKFIAMVMARLQSRHNPVLARRRLGDFADALLLARQHCWNARPGIPGGGCETKKPQTCAIFVPLRVVERQGSSPFLLWIWFAYCVLIGLVCQLADCTRLVQIIAMIGGAKSGSASRQAYSEPPRRAQTKCIRKGIAKIDANQIPQQSAVWSGKARGIPAQKCHKGWRIQSQNKQRKICQIQRTSKNWIYRFQPWYDR